MAQGMTKLKVMVFPGMTNFPIFAAQHKGTVRQARPRRSSCCNTPNSKMQRDGLAKGDHQIIQSAADNAVAMVELAKSDAVIVTGGDNGFNRIFVQPEIKSLADLRGKTVVVDAPNTAFALLLYKALKNSGLNKGDYKVNPVGGTPARLEGDDDGQGQCGSGGAWACRSSSAPTAAGLKDMGAAAKSIGAYQSDCAIVMRDWAKANSDTLVRYIKAVVEGAPLDPRSGQQGGGHANPGRSAQAHAGHRGAVLRHRGRPDATAWPRTPSSTWRASRTS